MIPLKLIENLVNEDRVNAAFSFLASRPLQATILHRIHPVICDIDQYLIINGMHDALSQYVDTTFRLDPGLNASSEGFPEFCSWVMKSYGAIQTGSILFNRKFCDNTTIPILEEASRSISAPNDLIALLAISQFTNQTSDAINMISKNLLSCSKTQIHILRALAEWSSHMIPSGSQLNKRILPLVFDSIKNTHHLASAVIILEKLSAPAALRYDLACLAVDSFESLGLDVQAADYLHNYIIRYLDQSQLESLQKALSDQSTLECPFSISLLQSIIAWQHIQINEPADIDPCVLTISQYLSNYSDYLYSASDEDPKQASPHHQVLKQLIANKNASQADKDAAISEIRAKLSFLRPE
ncbi:MAG: hypothetical protein ACK5FE_11140 [Cyanobacteriota bacterium]|jgi:hypothetical protein